MSREKRECAHTEWKKEREIQVLTLSSMVQLKKKKTKHLQMNEAWVYWKDMQSQSLFHFDRFKVYVLLLFFVCFLFKTYCIFYF